MTTPFADAMNAWAARIGPARVLDKIKATARYGACTSGIRRVVSGAVIPENAAHVAAIVRIAAQQRVPIYPISTGHNWGYGSSSPTQADCVVMDLSDLNRVLSVDPILGLASIEPGVTQAGLHRYLKERDLPFMVPVTGAGPNCSLVGNALERGYGITPIADHFAAVMSLEAVLPNGEIYRSALAEMGASRIDNAYKWAVGPYLDGLFAQGSAGIVTSMTLALARRPKRIEAFFFSARDEAGLEGLVDGVREVLGQLGGITGAINLMNRRRVLAMTCPYPQDAAGPQGVLPPDVVAKMGTQHGIAPWTGVGALYGTNEVVAAARRVVKKILRPKTDSLHFLDEKRLGQLKTIGGWARLSPNGRPGRMLRTAEAALQLMSGVPSEVALPLAYWRSGRSIPMDDLNPARDGCGLIWYPPLVPMTAAEARDYVDLVEATCSAHGIEPLITLTSQSERCFDSSVPLLFDQTDPQATERAQACYHALFEGGRARGFLPYRLSVDAMPLLTHSGSPFWNLVRDIKNAIDPSDIIAPGRYCGPPT